MEAPEPPAGSVAPQPGSDQLQLECPRCEARFALKKYVPDKKVRCRKCRAIIRIPIVEEYLTGEQKQKLLGHERPIDRAVQAKVARLLSVRRLLLVTACLLALLAGGIYVMVLRARVSPAPAAVRERDRVTLRWLERNNGTFALPLWLGYEWVYAIGERQEERKVVLQSGGADDPPVFDIAIAHPARPSHMIVRVEDEGVVVTEERRGSDRWTFSPPLRMLRLPLSPGDAWAHEGDVTRAGGSTERVELEFRVETEVVESGIGKRDCYKVRVTGTRGASKVDETLWYAPGVGLVKRATSIDGVMEEARLVRYKQ